MCPMSMRSNQTGPRRLHAPGRPDPWLEIPGPARPAGQDLSAFADASLKNDR
jgi:hypothetical protein